MSPQVWYLSTGEGRISRRARQSIAKEDVAEAVAGLSAADVVGTEFNFLSDGRSQLTISAEYITKSMLADYLSRGNHSEGRIFQRFVYPQGDYNCTIGASC